MEYDHCIILVRQTDWLHEVVVLDRSGQLEKHQIIDCETMSCLGVVWVRNNFLNCNVLKRNI